MAINKCARSEHLTLILEVTNGSGFKILHIVNGCPNHTSMDAGKVLGTRGQANLETRSRYAQICFLHSYMKQRNSNRVKHSSFYLVLNLYTEYLSVSPNSS